MKTLISELTVTEKIKLLDCLYHELSGHGTDGDTELAHINTREAAVLKALGGSGTVNEITGLRQYGKGSPPPPPPSATSMTQEIPEELKPYITDILAKSQAIQEKRTDEGYRPYTGPQLADFTPEQRQAFEQASGLQGLTGTYQDRASELTDSSAMAPTGEQLQQYMNPYMQNVVDIQQREAQRQADVAGQQLASQSVATGGFGGSRQAILEAEASRNLQTQLGDIQAKGLLGSYEDAQARLAAQKQREFSAGTQFSQLGQSALQGNLAEQQALQQAGGMQQAQQQAAFDIAKGQFEEEKTFPEQNLQQYSSIVRGYAAPIGPSTNRMTTTPAPTYLQQLAGLGTTALGVSKMFPFKEGGKIGGSDGLASIVVRRKKGGKVINMQEGGTFDPESANINQLLSEMYRTRKAEAEKAPGYALTELGLGILSADPSKTFLQQVGEAGKTPLKTLASAKKEEQDALYKMATVRAKAGTDKKNKGKFSTSISNNLGSWAATQVGLNSSFDKDGKLQLRSVNKAGVPSNILNNSDAQRFEEVKMETERVMGVFMAEGQSEISALSNAKRYVSKQLAAAKRAAAVAAKKAAAAPNNVPPPPPAANNSSGSPNLGSFVPKQVP